MQISLNFKRAIRDRVAPIPAPAHLKRLLRRSFCPSKIPRVICYAALPSMLVILVGVGYITGRAVIFTSHPHPAEGPSAVQAEPELKVIQGEFICVRCEGNEQSPHFRKCAEVGHVYAVKAKDGSLWFILPGSHLQKLISPNLSFHSNVRIAGYADTQNHSVELASFEH